MYVRPTLWLTLVISYRRLKPTAIIVLPCRVIISLNKIYVVLSALVPRRGQEPQNAPGEVEEERYKVSIEQPWHQLRYLG
jgi:hypothetical protein